jgi:hypothetical protein
MQVLNPMQAAIAFSLTAPLYPDMLPLVEVLAATRERAPKLVPALRPLSPGLPRPLTSETKPRTRRSLDFQVRSSFTDFSEQGYVQPIEPPSSPSSLNLSLPSPRVRHGGASLGALQCGEVAVGSKASREDVLASLVALSKTPSHCPVPSPAGAPGSLRCGSFDIARAMQSTTLTCSGSQSINSPLEAQSLLRTGGPVMGEIRDWPRANHLPPPITSGWPATQGTMPMPPNPDINFGRKYVQHWTAGTGLPPAFQGCAQLSGDRDTDEGLKRLPSTSGAMMADLQSYTGSAGAFTECPTSFAARRASFSSLGHAITALDTLIEAGVGAGSRASVISRRCASISSPGRGAGFLDMSLGTDVLGPPAHGVGSVPHLSEQAPCGPGGQSPTWRASTGLMDSEAQLATFHPPGKDQLADNAPVHPFKNGPVDVPRSPFSFAQQAMPSTPEAMGLWPTSQANSATFTEGGNLEDDVQINSHRSVSLRNWLDTVPWAPHAMVVADKQFAPNGGSFKPHPIGCTAGLEGPSLRRFLSVGQAHEPQPGASPDATGFRKTLLGGWQPGNGYQSRAGGSSSQSVEGVRGATANNLRSPRSMPNPSPSTHSE